MKMLPTDSNIGDVRASFFFARFCHFDNGVMDLKIQLMQPTTQSIEQSKVINPLKLD
jgi:hypothetical protein